MGAGFFLLFPSFVTDVVVVPPPPVPTPVLAGDFGGGGLSRQKQAGRRPQFYPDPEPEYVSGVNRNERESEAMAALLLLLNRR